LDRITDLTASRTPATRTAGSGLLRVSRVGSRSVVTRLFAASPLKLLTPRNHGKAAWIYTSTYGGGLLGGDAVRLEVDVEPGAVALLSTQASTKVYRSPAGTRVELAASIGDGGLLVVLPDPVVAFAGSSFRQRQEFDLAGRAGLVAVDWFTSGRHGSGERWQFDCYASRVIVRRDGRPAVIDAVSLTPDEGNLTERLGRFDALCAIVVFGVDLDAFAETIVERVAAAPVGRRERLIVGASRVPDGCIVRLAGTSFEEVARAVKEYLAFVPALLGDDPWARKW
jgi:urease accessory protein